MTELYVPGLFSKKKVINACENETPKLEPPVVEKKLVWVTKNENEKEEKVIEEKPKVIQYTRHSAFQRRLEFGRFFDEEYETLVDIFDQVMASDERFFDKLRTMDREKALIIFAKFVFINCKDHQSLKRRI